MSIVDPRPSLSARLDFDNNDADIGFLSSLGGSVSPGEVSFPLEVVEFGEDEDET